MDAVKYLSIPVVFKNRRCILRKNIIENS